MRTCLLAFLSTVAAPAAAQTPYAVADAPYDALLQAEHAPGLVHGVVKDGRLVHLRVAGVADVATGRPVDGDTAFRIASMSKVFTALAILTLRDEGRLDLDAPVATYIPELRGAKPATGDSGPITVRRLLTHSAGYVTDDPWGDRQLDASPEAFSRFIAQGWLHADAPGLRYEYSNLGYALLGRVVTNVGGMPYQRFVRERLLRPLGMEATTYDLRDIPAGRRANGYRWEDGRWTPEPSLRDGEYGAMGGLWTTANDYARFVAFLLSAWPARDGPETGPVKRATLRELASAQGFPSPVETRDGGGRPCTLAEAYSYGMRTGSGCGIGRYFQHSGGLPGYGSNVLVMPEAGVGLFAFANRTYAPAFRANVAAAGALAEAGLASPRRSAVSPAVQAAVDGALAAYRAGRVQAMGPLLAENVLLDRSAERRDAELAALKTRHGDCRPGEVIPAHALRARFRWTCDRGALSGQVLLAPGPTPRVQSVEFAVP